MDPLQQLKYPQATFHLASPSSPFGPSDICQGQAGWEAHSLHLKTITNNMKSCDITQTVNGFKEIIAIKTFTKLSLNKTRGLQLLT